MANEFGERTQRGSTGREAPAVSRDVPAPGKQSLTGALSAAAELAPAPTSAAGGSSLTGKAAIAPSVSRSIFGGVGSASGKLPGGDREPHAAIAGKEDAGEASAEPAPQLRLAVSCVRAGDGGAAGPLLTGLGKTTVSGPTGLKSGAFSWVIQWVLDKPSPKGGCVVQGVETTFDVKDDKGAKVDPKTKGPDPANWPLWELWEIHKDKKVTTYAETGDTADDTYGMPTMGAKTKGSITIKGTAEFYEGLAKPDSFKVTAGSPAGILPIMRSKPTLAGGTGAISHNLTATWDSTGGDETTKLAVT